MYFRSLHFVFHRWSLSGTGTARRRTPTGPCNRLSSGWSQLVDLDEPRTTDACTDVPRNYETVRRSRCLRYTRLLQSRRRSPGSGPHWRFHRCRSVRRTPAARIATELPRCRSLGSLRSEDAHISGLFAGSATRVRMSQPLPFASLRFPSPVAQRYRFGAAPEPDLSISALSSSA